MVEEVCVATGSVLKLQFGAAQYSYISFFYKIIFYVALFIVLEHRDMLR
jgi:hypothetical protein